MNIVFWKQGKISPKRLGCTKKTGILLLPISVNIKMLITVFVLKRSYEQYFHVIQIIPVILFTLSCRGTY